MAILRFHALLYFLPASILIMTLENCATKPAYRTFHGNRFIVSAARSQFYKNGPAQAYGADAVLPKGQKVTMIVREFGFSQIRLENGQTGYVATDELTQLPPETPTPKPAAVASHRPAPVAPERGLDLSDTPAPTLPQ